MKFLNFILALLIVTFASACSDNDGPNEPVQFKVPVTEINFDENGGSKDIMLESPGKPVVTCDLPWVTLTEPTLNGSSTKIWVITLTISSNDVETERKATVNISYGQNSHQISITQVAKTPEPVKPDVRIGETATDAAKNIIVGWNIGNSLEVPSGETAWGNPMVSETLIQNVKDAGFNAVRIPCAWHSHLVADEAPYTINPVWMARVKEVVDYAINRDMYVVLNTHWDNGWLELHANEQDMDAVAQKEYAIWTQIAYYFAEYGEKLIFAGNNEVRNKRPGEQWENWGEPNAGEKTALAKYNQTFIDAVRATGGNNTLRNLVVQTWCCNPWRAFDAFTMPSDSSEKHLMVEVHFYDPQSFTHPQDNGQVTLWGNRKGFTDSTDNQEDYVENLFGKLNSDFCAKGVPVLLGEYGAITHSTTDQKMMDSQSYYLEFVTSTAKSNGIIPFYWDNGFPGVGTFGIFNRSNGSVAIPHALEGIMKGAK